MISGVIPGQTTDDSALDFIDIKQGKSSNFLFIVMLIEAIKDLCVHLHYSPVLGHVLLVKFCEAH